MYYAGIVPKRCLLFSKGYNIFVSGLAGTGRLSTVKKILEEVTVIQPNLFDYCYVNNFSDPDSPRLIKLPKSGGKELANAMNDTILFLRQRLPKLFEEDQYQTSRKNIVEEYQQKEKDILHHFDERIKPFGFVRGQLENAQGISQPEVFPLVEKEPVNIADIDDFVQQGNITADKANEFRENYKKFHN
ncbi:MAG: Lon-like protease helical domain-containing protein, partial [FCB group bacterium]